MFLRNPAPPRLPNPGDSYSRSYVDTLLNTLRLYFEPLSNVLSTLLGVNGGNYVQFAFANFVATSTQSAASTTTAYPIALSAVTASGFTLAAGSRITALVEGIYRVAATLQLANADAALRQVSVWYRVNGVDVANSRGDFTLPANHGSFPGALAVEVAQHVRLTPNDYVELVWCTESTGVTIAALAAGASPTRPAAPAVAAKVTYVSHL